MGREEGEPDVAGRAGKGQITEGLVGHVKHFGPFFVCFLIESDGKLLESVKLFNLPIPQLPHL